MLSFTPPLDAADFIPALLRELAPYCQTIKAPAVYKELYYDIISLTAPGEEGVQAVRSLLDAHPSFFTDPASSRYHGAVEGGLAAHSLLVFKHALELYPLLVGPCAAREEVFYLALSCLFHDICKAGMYELSLRNKQNPSGAWVKIPCYKIKEGVCLLGHGEESVYRISRVITLPKCWLYAVRFHMGAYQIADADKINLTAALARYPQVLLLQTADLWAGIVQGV